MDAALLVEAAVLGLIIGSFLNVVIHRVPLGESIIRPSSRCPRCGTPLRAVDNIPVISYVRLGGRCRTCRTRISPRYPLVEVANAGVWLAAAVRFDWLGQVALVALTGSVLLALSLIDIEHHRLPNAVVYPSTIVAVVWVVISGLVEGNGDVVVTALLCGLTASGVLFLIAFIAPGGMGMGDVKLMALVGTVTGSFGWEVTVAAVFGGFLIGGVTGILLIATGKAGRKTKVAFGPSLAAGAMAALFIGPSPVRAWFGV